MSEFVNYNKRSIQLPPGCKDLADLFKPAWQRNLSETVAPAKMPVVLRRESGTATWRIIEKYVVMVFNSRADSCHLKISDPVEAPVLSVSRTTDSIASHVAFIHSEAQEKLMRSFFYRHGLVLPHAGEVPGKVKFPFPDLPVWSIYDFSPMPSEALAFAKIASDLFRELCGMNDQSEIHFFLIEFEKAK
jgi:hypothetical protein